MGISYQSFRANGKIFTYSVANLDILISKFQYQTSIILYEIFISKRKFFHTEF